LRHKTDMRLLMLDQVEGFPGWLFAAESGMSACDIRAAILVPADNLTPDPHWFESTTSG
jgi:hypothetical protein